MLQKGGVGVVGVCPVGWVGWAVSESPEVWGMVKLGGDSYR